MIEARTLGQHYREVRDRLRNPPNAVPDTGIDLKRKKVPPIIQPIESVEPELPVSLYVPIKKATLTFSSTLKFVAKEFGLSSEQIRLRTRIPTISLPRQIAIYFASKNNIKSAAWLGRYLGTDHSTVLHARDKVLAMVNRSILCKQYLDSLEEKLLADYNGTPVPTLSQPYLGSKEAKGAATV